jgi:hypothetical protein
MTDAVQDPYSEAGLARLLLAEQARYLADTSTWLVPTTTRTDAAQGELVEEAARLVEKARHLLTLAVVHARINDTSWEQIGTALGRGSRQGSISRQAAHERYGAAERDFRERFLLAWLQPERAGEWVATLDDLAEVVARARAWVSTHREAGYLDDGDRPIEVVLPPMSTLERSTLVNRARDLLKKKAADPAVTDRHRRDLEIGLCHRKIELYEELNTQLPGDTDVLASLAAARARLAELQASE